jgi:hypothetical protein
MKTRTLALAIVLLATGISQAGDYYIYKDAAGRTWLSNQDPRKKDDSGTKRPDNVTIIKQYQWEDVATEGQLAGPVAPSPQTKAPK